MRFYIKIAGLIGLLIIISSFKSPNKEVKKDSEFDLNSSVTAVDTTETDSSSIVYKLFKVNAHASYYHDKFNGRKTASGEIFDNNLYTAAHKLLKFGTKIRVTNTVNDSSVIVTINDRGPFVKGRELDLSKKAFMEIAKFKKRGYLIVTIEVVEDSL
jgi:rare lipoprotein A